MVELTKLNLLKIKDHWLLIILWMIATLFNLNKGFHIDDTFHLEAADWISKHPFRPMSGLINWYHRPEEIYHFNQPVLFFYLLAGAKQLLGNGEVVLHLFQSIFGGIAIWNFYKIAKGIGVSYYLFATYVFVVAPFFLVNQNLMVDVPLIALMLLFFRLILLAENNRSYLKASLVLSACLLIKYSCLPLLIVFPFVLMRRRVKFGLFYALIPFAVLGLWSLWNYWEFGGVHLLGRKAPNVPLNEYINRLTAILLCLGCAIPFSAFFVFRAKNKLLVAFATVSLVFWLILPFVFYLIEVDSRPLLWYVFLINGLIALGLFLFIAIRQMKDEVNLILLLWFIGTFGFILFLSPFMATRHVLLFLAPMILMILRSQMNVKLIYRWGIAVVIGLYGFSLVASDWSYADNMRRIPSEIVVKHGNDRNYWTIGHWGWQWYSTKEGMKSLTLDTPSGEIETGDIVVIPENIASQCFSEEIELQGIDRVDVGHNIFTFFHVADNAGLYFSTHEKLPWYFSKGLRFRVAVFEVK